MSFDASRDYYAHPACGTLPCSCVWQHQPLTLLTFPCRHCAAAGIPRAPFPSMGDYEAHRLAQHERPLRTADGVVVALPLLTEEGAPPVLRFLMTTGTGGTP